MIDIPTLITKLRSAPQKVGTFDRGDPKPLDEYRVVLTGEERDRLVKFMEDILEVRRLAVNPLATSAEIERLKRTSGEG